MSHNFEVPYEADFHPDVDGLADALARLVAARSATGEPHVDPNRNLELPRVLPEEGLGGRGALDLLAGPALEQVSRLDHRGFLAHMDPPTPWPTWAAAQWGAAVNQNLLHPDTGPAARQLEPLVISWLAPAFGMDGGHLVPGSTVANLTALWAARDLTGACRVVTSTAAHLSVAKAAHLLGLELVEVPVDDRQRMRADLLPDDLTRSVVVLTAGTVTTGAVDPLEAGDGAAWRHVDAAWAGPLRLSAHAGILAGIETADSVAVSAHKWLYQPKESALVFFSDSDTAHRALSFGGSYLAAPNVGLLGSHGNAALPLAVTLLSWGRSGVAGRIEADMATAELFARLVEDHVVLELWGQPVTGVVNWRPAARDPAEVRGRLTDAWISLADIAGTPWYRSVVANPLADPQHVIDRVIDAL
ncbi:MAG: pyridoxal-dependent decarboxylase [Actinomycetota bacterium]|nr:pyridoxal-dependent decarboxylase [Actinomycetota bacterium]